MPIWGPTFAEMRDPSRLPESFRRLALVASHQAPLDPVNLFNITWKLADGAVNGFLFPPALTGIEANILVMSGQHFPTGSHKVGPAYSIALEHQLAGRIEAGKHTLVFPSTGNFGIGGSWVGPRLGYRSLVVLPAEMSEERFEKIRGFGADVIATPGCESNVKEIYDEVHRLRRVPENRILNQFEEMGNYRFHCAVTAPAAAELAKGFGKGQVNAYVSAMGSSGTIGAGDVLKATQGTFIVGLEPVQCPTLYNAGFGGHRIEGIGDKHVTWVHNVMNMDALMCIDDEACLRGLEVIQAGVAHWCEATGADPAEGQALVGRFGVSGLCNVLGAIKTAKFLGLGKGDNVVTLATDGFDRYPSVLAKRPTVDRDRVLRNLDVFHSAGLDWIQEGTRETRTRWHNQKYFTWVEQQGKTVDELRALADQSFWAAERAKAEDMDKALLAARAPLTQIQG